MRILELFGEPISHGGQESFVMNAISSLDKNKYTIDLCTPFYCDNECYERTIRSRDGKVVQFGLKFNPGGIRVNEMKPLKKMLQKCKYDIVHIHSGSVLFLALASYVARKEHIKKVIVHSHSSGQKKTFKHSCIQLMTSLPLLVFPTDYCACSKEAGEWKFPKSIVKEKMLIINNGIATEKFRFDPEERVRMRKMLGIADNTVVLGHVGRFTEEKNQMFLVDVLSLLLVDNEKKDIKLLLIGDGPLIKQVLSYAESKGVSGSIIHIAKTDAVYHYTQAMDIFLFPSKYEGLGMVAIEAQASGLPVIASNGVPSMINVTQNVDFEELDTKKWCNSIINYLNFDRTDTSRSIVESGFDNKTTAKAIEELYHI